MHRKLLLLTLNILLVLPKVTTANNDRSEFQQGHTSTITKNPQKADVIIAVVGRSGSGVSSTVRELVGPNSKCITATGNETLKNILEYVVDIPSTDYKLRLLDIPGFVDGRDPKNESQILASLKSIVQNSGPPDFFLALSRFDDNRFHGVESLFVKSLKRLELFYDVFLNKTVASTSKRESKIVFLLTYLMTTTKATQRRPNKTIEEFKSAIETYTTFPSPISIVVGDNKAETEHGAHVENGYYKLPNKQLYPKNIWEALIDLSSNDTTKSLFTTLMNNRETEMKCEARFIATDWENYDDDADAFLYLLTQKSITVEDTEVNREIQNVFDRDIDDKTKLMEGIVQKIALQLRLQQANITSKDDLPTSHSATVAFYQKYKSFSAIIPADLLNKSFKLKLPEYLHPLTVGYGYVLMEDELTVTPFKTNIYEPSPVGYQLPNFMKCYKLYNPDIKYFKSYLVNMTEYIKERLNYLEFDNKENINQSSFVDVTVKEGFNMPPAEGENVVTLTAVQEYRTLTCAFVSDLSKLFLSEEFIESVDSLDKLDTHNRDSVSEWKNWFSRWGSHLVEKSYGGGRLHGSLIGPNILDSRSNIDKILNSILKFTPFPVENLGYPSYRLYGGDSDTESANLYRLEQKVRENLIAKWEESLNSNFIMLNNEFRLQPMSKLVKEMISPEKGEMIGDAIEVLFKGELVYTRKRKTSPGGNNEGGMPKKEKLPKVSNQAHRVTEKSTPPPNFPVKTGGNMIPETENLPSFIQSQINSINEAIRTYEENVAHKKNQSERQHKLDLEQFDRLKEEKERLAKLNKDEQLRREKIMNERRRENEDRILQLKKESEKELEAMKQEREVIQRKIEEDNKQHELLLESIKKAREEKLRKEFESTQCRSLTGKFEGFYKCMLGIGYNKTLDEATYLQYKNSLQSN